MTATAPALVLAQMFSPGFPVGAFAYSHGLEQAFAGGTIASAADLEAWITELLDHGAGRSDAILLVAAMEDGADHAALAALARALAGSAERWEETRDQGAALSATLAALGEPTVSGAYPVVLGAAARGLGLSAEVVASLFLQAFASNLVSAAVRFMPLGQAEGQSVLAALRPVIAEVAAEVIGVGLDGLGQAAFGADLAAMEHEELEVRIFRT